MAQLAQRLCLDLTDAFARHTETLADLLESSLMTVDQAETQLQDTAFARHECGEEVLDLAAQHDERGGIRRSCRLSVLDEVAEVRFLLFTDGRLQRDRILRDLDDLPHPLGGDAHLFGDLFLGGVTSKLL